MPLIDVPDCRLKPQRLQGAHTPYAKNDFLFHAHHLVAAIQSVGDVAVTWAVARQIGVQQV